MTQNFINKVNVIHNNHYNYSLVDYKNNTTKIKIICPKHGIFEQMPKSHLRGNGCPICAFEIKKQKFTKNPEILIDEFNNRHNNKYDYSLVNYINNKTKIIIICPIHGKFEITPSHHLNGVGCRKCSNNYSYTNQEFINKANIIHNNFYDYSLVNYINSKTKIKIICPIHGIFEQVPSHHLNKVGCPKCNSSKGEDKIRYYLNNSELEFIEQKRFKDCRYKKPLPFDFYLPKRNICIEFDGEQHFKIIRSEQDYLNTMRNDKIKNYYCKENNLNLIRISFEQTTEIENILNNLLKTKN